VRLLMYMKTQNHVKYMLLPRWRCTLLWLSKPFPCISQSLSSLLLTVWTPNIFWSSDQSFWRLYGTNNPVRRECSVNDC
jgi:hypothetical protein